MWWILLFIQTVNGLQTYTDLSTDECIRNNDCGTFECGKTDDCKIECTDHGKCEYLDIKVYDNDITIIGNNAFYQTHITAYNTRSLTYKLTFNHPWKTSAFITTYGVGDVFINLDFADPPPDFHPRDSRSINLRLHGAHANVEINIPHLAARGQVSAINVKNFKMDLNFKDGDIYLPISDDAATHLNALSVETPIIYSWNKKNYKRNLYSLKGTSNIAYFCDGNADKTDCIANADADENPFGMFYGSSYHKFCRYSHGECDNIDTKIGSQLDGYSIIYLGVINPIFDLSSHKSNLFVYLDNSVSDIDLLGPNDADIILIVLPPPNVETTYNFMLSNNVILNGYLKRSTVYGPKNSFQLINNFKGFMFSSLKLEKTNSINVDVIKCGSDIYVGDSTDVTIACSRNSIWPFTIHTNTNPNCVPLNDYWTINIDCANKLKPCKEEINFAAIGITCKMNPTTDTDKNCSDYLRTQAEIDELNSTDCSDTTKPPLTEVNYATYLTELVLDGDYDKIVEYFIEQGIDIKTGFENIIAQSITSKKPGTVIKIIENHRGSIVIEYSLIAPDKSMLDEAIPDKQNAFGLIGTIVSYGDFEMPVKSSSVVRTMTSSECLLGSDSCSTYASCKEISGLFKCVCNNGFVGNGRICCEQPSKIFDDITKKCVSLCLTTNCINTDTECNNGGYTAYSSQGTKTWREARSFCRGKGVELASFQNVVEWKQAVCACSALMTVQGNSLEYDCWIGLNDINTEGKYQWTSSNSVVRPPFTYGNDLVPYKPWEKDAPNDNDHSQNAISINIHNHGFWQDWNGYKTMHFVCNDRPYQSAKAVEFPIDVNNDFDKTNNVYIQWVLFLLLIFTVLITLFNIYVHRKQNNKYVKICKIIEHNSSQSDTDQYQSGDEENIFLKQ
eukprot:303119_1